MVLEAGAEEDSSVPLEGLSGSLPVWTAGLGDLICQHLVKTLYQLQDCPCKIRLLTAGFALRGVNYKGGCQDQLETQAED